MKLIKIFLAVMSIVCLFDMPYGYYQLYRFLAMGVFLTLAINEKNNENTFTTMLIPSKQNKIAARIPGDKNLLHFLKLVNKPILSTSANLSGEITCRNIQEIKTIFDGKVFGAYDAPLGDEKKPSRILDLINNEYIR